MIKREKILIFLSFILYYLIMETEEDNYYDIEKWLCLDKELSYCLNIAKENYKTYKNKNIHLRIYK